MQDFLNNTAHTAPPLLDALPAEKTANHHAVIGRKERVISAILRGGVLLSAFTIAVGVVLFYLRDAQSAHGLLDHPYPHTLPAVLSGLAQGNPIAIIALGLLLLLATPVVNVAISIFAFALERDWRFVMITALVLAILIASFLLGKGGA